MDRGSDKHGPRVDEELEQETRGLTQGGPTDSRAEDWREPEPSGEDEPLVSLDPEQPGEEMAGEARGTVSEADRDDRATMASYLRRSVFPAKRDELIKDARSNQAPDHVIDELSALDSNAVFQTAAQAWAAATGRPEHEHRF